MFKLDLEEAEEPEIKLPTSAGSQKSKKIPEKTSTSALLTTPKPLTVRITTNCEKFLEVGIPDHLTCLLQNLCAGQEVTELDMEQWAGSKLGKEQDKAVYGHLVYLNHMQNISCEKLGQMNHKLDSRLLGEISITSYMQMMAPLWQKTKGN